VPQLLGDSNLERCAGIGADRDAPAGERCANLGHRDAFNGFHLHGSYATAESVRFHLGRVERHVFEPEACPHDLRTGTRGEQPDRGASHEYHAHDDQPLPMGAKPLHATDGSAIRPPPDPNSCSERLF
jgi:hypothetical protein